MLASAAIAAARRAMRRNVQAKFDASRAQKTRLKEVVGEVL